MKKVAWVAAGYVAAFAIAFIAVAIHVALTNNADRQSSSGMYAFGDLMLFCAVFTAFAVIPSAAALWVLRPYRAFWTTISILALAVASTAVAALTIYFTDRTSNLGGLTPLRILATPGFAVAFLVATIFAPRRGPRWALLLACATEVLVGGWWAGWLWLEARG